MMKVHQEEQNHEILFSQLKQSFLGAHQANGSVYEGQGEENRSLRDANFLRLLFEAKRVAVTNEVNDIYRDLKFLVIKSLPASC
jgi:hypothetical protein